MIEIFAVLLVSISLDGKQFAPPYTSPELAHHLLNDRSWAPPLYIRSGLSLRNSRSKLKTLKKLPIVLEESIKDTTHLINKKTKRCQHCVVSWTWKH